MFPHYNTHKKHIKTNNQSQPQKKLHIKKYYNYENPQIFQVCFHQRKNSVVETQIAIKFKTAEWV